MTPTAPTGPSPPSASPAAVTAAPARAGAAALVLGTAAVLYALAADALLPAPPGTAATLRIFLAGAVPALVIVAALRLGRPGLVARPLARALVAAALAGPAAVAVLAALLPVGG